MIIEMMMKDRKAKARVYKFFEDGKTALVWSDMFAGECNGNGWRKVAVKNLVPVDVYEELYGVTGKFMSKTERNHIKSHLKLTKAEWTCTDGTSFDVCDEAIAHEKVLLAERDASREAIAAIEENEDVVKNDNIVF